MSDIKSLYEIIRKRRNKKIVPNRVFLHNIWGKYSDNTKALAEAYHRIHPDWEVIYEIGANENTDEIPGYIRTTVSGTDECLDLMFSSRVVIDNDWGAIKKSGVGFRGKLICSLYKRIFSSKTLYVSTGHGTPLKKIGFDAVTNHTDTFVTSTELMGVLDAHSKEVYDRITMGAVKNIMVTGSPRNDVLFIPEYCETIRKRIGLEGKRLLLFAPTFRTKVTQGRVQFVGVENLMNNVSDYADQIVEALEKKFGGKWVIGLRVHPGAVNNFNAVFNDVVIDANRLTDMADYLCITDLLVTDYSSCFFDYMLTKKPCIMLWADEKEYSKSERGMYFEEQELPYPVVRDFAGLINCIDSLEESKLKKAIASFMEKYSFSTNTEASKTIIQCIDESLS